MSHVISLFICDIHLTPIPGTVDVEGILSSSFHIHSAAHRAYCSSDVTLNSYYMPLLLEDFPPLGIPNVHSLIPDSKPYLVVKIIDI
jgi:hypothetical protein